MIRLLSFFTLILMGSLLCVALIKIAIVGMAEIFCQVKYQWGYEDVRFILWRGSFMGVAFCALGWMRYNQMKKNSQ